MVVPYADELEPGPWTQQQLFSGMATPASHSDIVANDGIITFDGAENKNWRIPALFATVTASFIDCGPVPTVPHASLVTGHGTRQSAVHRFACDEGYYLKGPSSIVCNSNGQWSQLPVCKPLGNCIWNERRKKMPTKPQIKILNDEVMGPTPELQQEVSQMVIFTSLPIRCTGLVKEWRFLTMSKNVLLTIEPFVIHIDIWRLIDSASTEHGMSNQEYILVGTNTIAIKPIPDASLLTYNVPPESQIFVQVGDIVGWHYDGPSSFLGTSSSNIPIVLMSNEDEENGDGDMQEAILAPVFHASLRVGDRHRFTSAVRRRTPSPRLEAFVDNSQAMPYGLCDGDTTCPANSDCLRRNCFAPACVCRDGFALNANNTLCLPAVQLNQRCDSSVACEAFNSRCSERGVCECLTGWEAASDGRRCRPVSPTAGLAFALRGERCDATRQCYHRWYDQTCSEGVCRCRDGFRAATSIERRAFPHSATECRPSDYNLTSASSWGDEAWQGDGSAGAGCSLGGSVAGAVFDPYPTDPDGIATTSSRHIIPFALILGSLASVAVVGLVVSSYNMFRRRVSWTLSTAPTS